MLFLFYVVVLPAIPLFVTVTIVPPIRRRIAIRRARQSGHFLEWEIAADKLRQGIGTLHVDLDWLSGRLTYWHDHTKPDPEDRGFSYMTNAPRRMTIEQEFKLHFPNATIKYFKLSVF